MYLLETLEEISVIYPFFKPETKNRPGRYFEEGFQFLRSSLVFFHRSNSNNLSLSLVDGKGQSYRDRNKIIAKARFESQFQFQVYWQNHPHPPLIQYLSLSLYVFCMIRTILNYGIETLRATVRFS